MSRDGERIRLAGAAALGGLVTGLVLLLASQLPALQVAAAGAGSAGSAAVRAVYRAAAPAVVAVDAVERTGSGFLVDGAGHVVTNAHVVGDRRQVTIELGGRRQAATVRGVEQSVDVAVLTLSRPADVPGLSFAAGEGPRVGDPVVAIGAPFGLAGSLSSGIVSGLRRQITSPNGFAITGVLQTDAALNPGNSGGPLLDMSGRVVGMATQIATDNGRNEGIGFAIPADVVQRTAAEIIRTGRASLPYLGVVGGDAADGVLVGSVVPGSPVAGLLQAGDVLRSLDGRPTPGNAGLAAALAGRAAGDRVTLEVLRGGATRTVTAVLAQRPAQEPAAP